MKKFNILLTIIVLVLCIPGCASGDKVTKQKDETEEVKRSQQSKDIAECYREIYQSAVNEENGITLNTVKKIVEHLGDEGYAAVDCANQVDMVNPNQVEKFAAQVEQKEKAEVMILCVEDDGYLFFEKPHQPGGSFGHTAIRVSVLDETCRELNRKYIMPIGYSRNNLFITDWSEGDFHNLNFYDLYDVIFLLKYQINILYESTSEGKIYEIPKTEFEEVLKTYFSLDESLLQKKTVYNPQNSTYEYRPRGIYDCGPGIQEPYPEVVSYRENEDKTVTLTVNVVWPEEKLVKALSHEVVVRPLEEGRFQYVSNHVIPSKENVEPKWYKERLTDAEWEVYYKK